MRIHDHARQPRRQRQRAQALAFRGDAAIAVERAEFGEQAVGFLQCRRRRRVEKRQRRGIADAPLREIEHHRGQVGGEDLGLGVGRQRRGLRLVPQPVTDAGFGAAGAATALIDGGARGAHGLQPRQTNVRLVARHPRHAGVHDNTHALDGQRGLGNGRRQHHLALTFRRRRDGAVLHSRIERAEQRHDLDAGVMDALAKKILGAADFGGARQEGQHRAGIGAQRRRDGIRHLPLQRRIGLAAEITGLDRKGAALAGDNRRVAEQFGDPRAIERRRHHQDAQILAQAGLGVARQRQAQIRIERALVKFVEQHGGDAVEFGVVENLPREDALGHDFDPGGARNLRAETNAIADGLAGAFAERLRHPFGAGAGRDPARLQHDDLFALQPGRVEQRQRHPRGLAGAGRRDQHRGVVRRERLREFIEHDVDREWAYRRLRGKFSPRHRHDPAYVPGIHVLLLQETDVDGRDKPGHDGNLAIAARYREPIKPPARRPGRRSRK